MEWGTRYIISRGYCEAISRYSDYSPILPSLDVPLQVICAGSGILKGRWASRMESIRAPHELVIIEGAGHCFDEGSTEIDLFTNTARWFAAHGGPQH